MNGIPAEHHADNQIVICDDDEDILEFLAVLLENSGYQPLNARSMYEVFTYIRNQEPRLLLLDIQLPDNDGFEVAEVIRRNKIEIPIIFITAHGNGFSKVYSQVVGCAGYFTKPLDDYALLTRIADVLKQPLQCTRTG